MFSESAELYDTLYRTFKDFAAEAGVVAGSIKRRCPYANTVLDVGCGTGEHAKYLQEVHGFSVSGLDLDARLLAVAKAKLPQSEFFQGDMAAFELGRTFDVILCLFSAIGYLKTLDRVEAALLCFRRHLKPGGIVMIEPWYEPGVLREGPGVVRRAEGNGIRVERSANTRIEKSGVSILDFTYRVKDADQIRVIEERHELGLFTKADMLRCFSAADLSAEYESPGLGDRGLYVARHAARGRDGA